MKIKQTVVALLLSTITIGNIIAAPKLQIVEILGNQYYVYEVKKGDSIYGIAKEYGWDANELARINKQAANRLEKGARLYYPIETNTIINKDNDDNIDLSVQKYEPISHIVKRGETVYSISRLYNIPIETIYKICPESRHGIKEGQVITFPSKNVEGDNAGSDFTFYKIKSGDTLYSLAKNYGTTVETILNYNPGLSVNTFRAGETIKIPTDGRGVLKEKETIKEAKLNSIENYKVEKNDTWESIADKTGVDKEELILANGSQRIPKKNTIVAIPVIDSINVEREVIIKDPREETRAGREDIYEEVNKIISADSAMNVKITLLLSEPSSRKDLEVARGFLTSIDKLKRKDYRITFNVVDGSKPAPDVLGNLEEISPTIVFYTAEKAFPSYLAEYAEQSKTPVVNLFDTRDDKYTSNPYIMQFLTPTTYFNEEVAHKLVEKAGKGRTIIFVGNDEEPDPIEQMLRKELSDSPILSLTTDEFKDYPVIDENSYLIYANPVKKTEVSEIIERVITNRQEQPLADIIFVGKPNWIVYEDSMKDKFFESSLILPSRFYLDSSTSGARSFVNNYNAIFDHNPVKSYPLYAGVGYDMGNYFIPALSETRGDLNELPVYSEPLQSGLNFTRLSNWSGFYNPVCYLINYRPYGAVVKEALGTSVK